MSKSILSPELFNRYVELGFQPILIRSNKAPITPSWNSDSQPLEYQENQLYGVIPPPSIVIVDVDTKNNKQGLASWQRFVEDNPSLLKNCPDLVTNPHKWCNVRTGSGGFHFYVELTNFLGSQDLPKKSPRYPDIEFLRHGKEQAVMGNQQLDNGWYQLNSLIPLQAIDSLECFQVKESMNKQEFKAVPKFTVEQIRKLLTYVNSDDYETWYRTGFALMELPFSEEDSYSLFEEWSSKSSKFSETKCREQWSSLKNYSDTTKDRTFTVWSLVYLAQTQNPSKVSEIYELMHSEDVGGLIGRFCNVQSRQGDKYYDLKTKAFYREDGVLTFLHPLIDYVSKTKQKKKSKLQDLLNLGMIHTVTDQIFNPTKATPLFYDDFGASYLNSYDPDFVPKPINITSQNQKMIDFYLRHCAQICSEKYVSHILDFFRYLAQHPGHKIRWMPVIEGGVRTGKGLLLEAIRYHVLGDRHHRVINTKDFLSDNNSWAVGSLLVQIEELLIKGKGALESMNVIKTLITNPKISRVEKYMTTKEVDNFTSYIALTNHTDCLRHADRGRYFPIKSPIRVPEDIDLQGHNNLESYYKYLAYIGSLANKDGGALLQYFLTTKISDDFCPDIPPKESDFDLFQDAVHRAEGYDELIEFINYLAGTETLPKFIDTATILTYCNPESREHKEYKHNQAINKEMPDIPYVEGGITDSYMKTFGKRVKYKSFRRWLYPSSLNDNKVKLEIREICQEKMTMKEANAPKRRSTLQVSLEDL